MTQVSSAINWARSQIGDKYAWGATGPDAFDCSGLVQAAYRAAGVNLPRTTYQQAFVGTAVTKADLQPGDLVFPNADHVQIYVGNGRVVEAPRAGLAVREVPMWGFWRARRVAAGGASAASAASSSTASESAAGGLSVAPAMGATITKTLIVILAGGLVIGGLVLATKGGMLP